MMIEHALSCEIPKQLKPNGYLIASTISSERPIIYYAEDFYVYVDGYYQKRDELIIRGWIKDLLGRQYSSFIAKEIIECLKIAGYKSLAEVNDSPLLNLKNGLLALDSFKLSEHSPSILSTIQLPVQYDPGCPCPKWLTTLDVIFDGDKKKIQALQEFFGLCLTRVINDNYKFFWTTIRITDSLPGFLGQSFSALLN